MNALNITCAVLGAASFCQGQTGQHLDLQITATVTDTYVKKLIDGNILTNTVRGKFYRDTDGRVRIERDGQISIQDPVEGFSAVLDPATRVARQSVSPKRSSVIAAAELATPVSGRSGGSVTTSPLRVQRPPTVDLGKTVVSGFEVTGTRFTTVVPIGAVGNLLPITLIREVWSSRELHLPLIVKTMDPLNGEHVTSYSDIDKASQPDPLLFAIPSDYQILVTSPDEPVSAGQLRSLAK